LLDDDDDDMLSVVIIGLLWLDDGRYNAPVAARSIVNADTPGRKQACRWRVTKQRQRKETRLSRGGLGSIGLENESSVCFKVKGLMRGGCMIEVCG